MLLLLLLLIYKRYWIVKMLPSIKIASINTGVTATVVSTSIAVQKITYAIGRTYLWFNTASRLQVKCASRSPSFLVNVPNPAPQNEPSPASRKTYWGPPSKSRTPEKTKLLFQKYMKRLSSLTLIAARIDQGITAPNAIKK